MRPASTTRPTSLAPLVRSEAEIAAPADSPLGAAASPAGIPGAIDTPTGGMITSIIPRPPSHRSYSSHPSNAGRQDGGSQDIAPYNFTLVDLNERSYWLVHVAAASSASTAGGHQHSALATGVNPNLAELLDLLRSIVILANLEVCMVRSWQLWPKSDGRSSSDPTNFLVDLNDPHFLEDPPNRNAKDEKDHRDKNADALAPVAILLGLPDRGLCSISRVRRALDDKIKAARNRVAQPALRDALRSAAEETLAELAYTFAAYQPAVLDEDIKGSQSPYDPRSHTKSIQDVKAGVKDSLKAAGTRAPDDIADLATVLLGEMLSVRREFPFTALLLQSGCMSGQSELVEAVLNYRQGRCKEMEIIKRLCNGWAGYRGGKCLQSCAPLAAGGGGSKDSVRTQQTLDWLDFKCSCARAVIIAHKVMETVMAWDDKDMNQSLQLSYAGPALAAAAAAAGAVPQEPSAAPNGVGPQPVAEARRSSASGAPLVAIQAGPGPQPAVTRPGTALTATMPLSADEARKQPDHAELSEKKWTIVKSLFKVRPAACKPLALAILHVVLATRRQINKEHKAQLAKEKAAEEQQRRVKAAAAGAPLRSSISSDAEEDEEEARNMEERDRARLEEAQREGRYRNLHRLAVQACHLAVHASSLSVVSDAILCIRAVRAWPAIDLEMLNDLAEAFPVPCAQLLEALPLEVVDLEDNVLPFALPSGFITVATSVKDKQEFAQSGGSGSIQDAEHFATQVEEDATIDASLLVQGTTWLSFLFLFLPSELASPTTRKLLRISGCALRAFLWQGPGSCIVAVAFVVLLAVLGVTARILVALFRIVLMSILGRIAELALSKVPGLRTVVSTVRGTQGSATAIGIGAVSARISLAAGMAAGGRTGAAAGGGTATNGGGNGVAGGADADDGEGSQADDTGSDSRSDDDDGDEGIAAVTANLGRGIWHAFFAHGHNAIIDGSLGWGKGSASIACRKVPIPIPYAPPAEVPLDGTQQRHSRTATGRPSPVRGSSASAGGASRQHHRQLDTSLLEKLLKAPGIHPSVFGSKVLRALILFKWNYFTKYFIILQFLLHVTYMGVFLAYAFTIKDMEPVDGRESGPGADTPGCQLQAPDTTQTALLIVLAVMTVDFTIQELRQIRHFGLHFFTHTWDILDVCSVALVVASISLHFSCTSGVSPLTLRGLAAVQIILLFMRLLYYAMASDKLGSFVRMVLETTYDLMMFFAFLSVVFVGFALAIIISQGALADEEQTFIKLFTMMYGDFDVSYLSTLDSGALGLDALTRVLASLYMIMVTIILLNLLISIISESYERIRENERWESLRNKALLVVESETQLYQFFLRWLYKTLTAPSDGSVPEDDKGKRYLYVITPENARKPPVADDVDDDDEEEEEDDGDDEDGDDGQWNGRLGEMKKHISAQGRSTVEGIRKELNKALGQGGNGGGAKGTAGEAGGAEGAAGGGDGMSVSHASSVSGIGGPVVLDERTVKAIGEHVGALVKQEVGKLKQELMAGRQGKAAAAAAASPPRQRQPPATATAAAGAGAQQQPGRPRLDPLPAINGASLPRPLQAQPNASAGLAQDAAES